MSEFLYHVTVDHRVSGINRHGVLASKARGKRKVSWWVDETMVLWAIAHVSHRHNVGTRRIRVIAEHSAYMDVRLTAWKGVYTTRENIAVLKGNWDTAYRIINRKKDNAAWSNDEIPF